MQEIKYNTRVFVEDNGQVMIRVRWNRKKNEVAFSVGCYADSDKWNSEDQRAKNNTTHTIGNRVFVARDINNRIINFLGYIGDAFTEAGLKEVMPDNNWLKERVNTKLGRVKRVEVEKEKTFKDLFEEFIKITSIEKNWTEKVHYKYEQAWNNLNSCHPDIAINALDKEKMIELKEWYVKNEYRNRTTNRHFVNLKAFLRWIDTNYYPIKKEVLRYKTNLTVVKKTVTFLKFKELLHFESFVFPPTKNYLDKARDMFCFMAATSLRHSDLVALRRVHISNGKIEVCTEKTNEKIYIDINEHAQRILDKYANYEGDMLFPVPSNQKLNDYLKEAAEMAGLDREVLDIYFIGTERHEEVKKFYEQISCHDARRTFICCSLAMGIPPTVVMSYTGHSDYDSMKPYIEVSDETKEEQMNKWNNQQNKTEIAELLNKMKPEEIAKALKILKQTA
ncbi:site-specific integrase [uncultured Odoribacter sp.]|uniref:site-specific integrase n=1 Tax=uncultured Odoribacter sp. TaxID=876416 RepID=UPI00260BF141|nr:site-specific integrase [uncultured Odoribacter sp.]